MVIDLVRLFVTELWKLFVESSLYILVGFAIAGLLHVWVPDTFIRRVLGHGRIGSIFTAAFLGIPLPLCSCSVLPTAIAMRRMGAGRGATVSYLISEPETGPDSIAITYGLMGPLIAIYRPVAALLAAIIAGLLVEFRGGPGGAGGAGERSAPGSEGLDCGHDHDHDHDHGAPEGGARSAAPAALAAAAARGAARGRFGWFAGALRYGFVDLLDDLAHWLLLGLALGAIVSAFIPASMIGAYLGSGVLPLVLMAVIGVPIYICAAASTPIAAALVLKGLSPGAALVLLLTGPATNLGSIAVLVRYLGRRVVGIYLAVVVVVSIAMGALLDAIYAALGTRPVITLSGEGGAWLPSWIWTGAALVLAALLITSLARSPVPSELAAPGRWLERLTGVRVSASRVAQLAAAFAAWVWLWTGVVIVEPGERATVLTFGRVSAQDLGPGLHLVPPAPVSRVVKTQVARSRLVELGVPAASAAVATPAADGTAPPKSRADDGYFLSAGGDVVEVEMTVEYRVSDAVAFALGLVEPDALVRALSRSAAVEEIGRLTIDDVYTTARRDLARMLREHIQQSVDRLGAGIEVDGVAVLHVTAPALVRASFRDVASAQQDAFTTIESARGYGDALMPVSRGQAAGIAAESEAASLSEIARASAEAAAFAVHVEALGDARALTEHRLWIEALESALPGRTKIVRGGSPGAGTLDVWLDDPTGLPPFVGGFATRSVLASDESDALQAGRTAGGSSLRR